MELMKLKGSKLLSNTWVQEIVLTDTGVNYENLVVGKRTNAFLPYENISQVSITNNILTSDLTLINTGGTQNIIVKALNKKEAAEAKKLIESKIKR